MTKRIVTGDQVAKELVGHSSFMADEIVYIVRAVNCHDELLEALRNIVTGASEGFNDVGVVDGIVRIAKQAIKKAEGR